MVRVIRLGPQRTYLDIVIAAIWVGGIFVKVALVYYAVALGLAQWLGLRNYRPLVVPVGILMVALSVMAYHGLSDLLYTELKIFPGYSLSHALLIPLLLLVVAWLRGWRAKG
jgi:spore germination protein KB